MIRSLIRRVQFLAGDFACSYLNMRQSFKWLVFSDCCLTLDLSRVAIFLWLHKKLSYDHQSQWFDSRLNAMVRSHATRDSANHEILRFSS